MHNARACQTEEVKVSRRSLCESVPRVITIHFPYLIYHCRWKSTKSRWRGVINYRSARYRGACANAHKSLPFTRITTPIIFTRCYVTCTHVTSKKTFCPENLPSNLVVTRRTRESNFAGIKDWTDRRHENIRVIGYRSTLPKAYRTFTITTLLSRLHGDVTPVSIT